MNIILNINTRLIKLTELGTQNSTAHKRVFSARTSAVVLINQKINISLLIFSSLHILYAYFPKSKTILFYNQNDFLSYLMIRRVDVWDKFVYN